ncbi:MAG: hypothetical protein C0390_11720 [Syntrophus sp. (in: bacteria)]|nr:hypothetical protein [Syntrophus sp. (in: bacteria)]
MLRLFNSLGKKREVFQPVSERVATLFTCGPSIYQRAHIGNFRTFLVYRYPFAKIPGISSAGKGRLNK